MKYYVSIWLTSSESVDVEVEADTPAEAMDLAYELTKDRIELDGYHVRGICPEDYDQDSSVDEYAFSIDREAAKRCFEIVLENWPEVIDVSQKKLLPDSGLLCPNLIDANDLVDEKLEELEEAGLLPIGSEDFFWELAYCVYGMFLAKAREAHSKICTRDTNFEEFERYFFEKHEGWKLAP